MSVSAVSRLEEVASELTRRVHGRVAQHEPLAPHTSFNVGGPADLWIEPSDLGDLCCAIRVLNQRNCPVTVLGNGSNSLISDRGIRGAVFCLKRRFRAVQIEGSAVAAGAGVSMPLLSQQVSRRGLSGYEWACGVPGSIGGSVVMNAGAHGGDTAGCVREIQLVSREGDDAWVAAADLHFRYRHSDLPDSGAIVTAARFQFAPDDPQQIQERLQGYREKRRAAQPETSQCAGSIFKNPPGGSAGRLLESLGAKGTRIGGAEVSEKHANFIVNAGGAAAEDIRRLIRRLQALALEGAGVMLEPEVLLMGDWNQEGV